MSLYRKQPTPDDMRLIVECKRERAKLKRQLSELTNDALARKFELSRDTVDRIKECDLA